MNFDNICIFHKHLRPTCDAEKKFVKKKITEANFSNLVSYLLYAYRKKSTETLLAKSILWAKLDMRILQRLALKVADHCYRTIQHNTFQKLTANVIFFFLIIKKHFNTHQKPIYR